jgi:membrane protease YdiL (CAAX protease family)
MSRSEWVPTVREWFQRALWDVALRDQQEPEPVLCRRRVTTVVVVLVGATVLGVSLRIEPGSAWFYPATLGLALVWTLGALVSGPLHLGRVAGPGGGRRPVISSVSLGLALAAVFVLGAFAVRQVPFLEGQVSAVLDHADRGSVPLLLLITAVNGVAEELFFRGAAYASIPRHQVSVTTVAYALVTFATGNVMLAFAALLLGTVVGLERRASGGILAPILTHVAWGVAMLLALPLIFG